MKLGAMRLDYLLENLSRLPFYCSFSNPSLLHIPWCFNLISLILSLNSEVVVLVTFLSLGKISQCQALKKERFIVALSFQRAQSIVSCLQGYGAWAQQRKGAPHMVATKWSEKGGARDCRHTFLVICLLWPGPNS